MILANYIYFKSLGKHKIFIQKTSSNSKAFDTVKKLKIDTMYNSHLEELQDLIKIKQAYSEKYIEKLQALFPKKNLSKNEVYRLLFGTELESVDFHKRPLSKFKKDILNELGVII